MDAEEEFFSIIEDNKLEANNRIMSELIFLLLEGMGFPSKEKYGDHYEGLHSINCGMLPEKRAALCSEISNPKDRDLHGYLLAFAYQSEPTLGYQAADEILAISEEVGISTSHLVDLLKTACRKVKDG